MYFKVRAAAEHPAITAQDDRTHAGVAGALEPGLAQVTRGVDVQ